MNFRLWKKHGKTRLYADTGQPAGGPFFDLSASRIIVGGGDESSRQRLTEIIETIGDSKSSAEDFIHYLGTHGHTVLKPGQRKIKNPKTLTPSFAGVDIRSPSEIALQTKQNPIGKTPFKKSSLKHLFLTIDTREPALIHSVFAESPLKVYSESLPVGDIRVASQESNATLVFERKTVSDLYSSVINTHMHSQAERLYEWQQAHNGKSRVIWIVEGELLSDGARTLYNALPQSKQVDGLINYWVGVLGQHIVQSYTPEHTAYLVHKIAQGFFEQQLPYPVKSNNGNRVDISAKLRKENLQAGAADSDGHTGSKHGVSISGRDTLFQVLCAYPSINSRIAQSLVNLGQPLQQILLMTESELLDLEGVGKKTAAAMIRDFAL